MADYMRINGDSSSISRILTTYQTPKISRSDNQDAVSPSKTTKSNEPNEIEDKAEISQASKDLLVQDKLNQSENTEKTEKSTDTKESKDLTAEEKENLDKLKQTDSEVKAHEQAHMAAAGQIAASAPQYQYEKGPDGKMYAVSGEVNIKISEGQDPEKTIEKAEQVKRVALAPVEPSSQDKNVASQADQMIQKAKSELNNSQNNTSDQTSANMTTQSDRKEQTAHSPGILVDVFG